MNRVKARPDESLIIPPAVAKNVMILRTKVDQYENVSTCESWSSIVVSSVRIFVSETTYTARPVQKDLGWRVIWLSYSKSAREIVFFTRNALFEKITWVLQWDLLVRILFSKINPTLSLKFDFRSFSHTIILNLRFWNFSRFFMENPYKQQMKRKAKTL